MKTITRLIITTFMLITAGTASAGSIENLERERALLIEMFLDPELEPTERQNRIAATKTRLIDLERMVLRDDSLTGRNTPIVRKAFANYELTFLINASMESDRGPFDIWMKQIGLTTAALESARIARRY